MHIWFSRVHQAALGTYFDLNAYNTRVQGLIFGVQVDLLQIFLCVQLPRSADRPPSPRWGGNSRACLILVSQGSSMTS